MSKKLYRAKRAIFLAAGYGSRLLPLTATIPKPLIKVNGVRIIDTLIDACLGIGITEIYIVRGYLSEQFDCLLKKYPMITFLENPFFSTTNNISSAFVARDFLENSYVFEADLFLNNPRVLSEYHASSDVLGIWKQQSDDWCLIPDAFGNISKETLGGSHCYQMVGIYFWTAEDARRLKTHLEWVFNSSLNDKQRYWETVPNQIFAGSYKVKILPCQSTDVIEIDTLTELQALDSSYL